MNKHHIIILAASLLAGPANIAWSAESIPAPASSNPGTPAIVSQPERAPATPRRVAGYPFRGRLGAIDVEKQTITVTTTNTKRVFPVNKDTKYVKNGKAAKLTDGVIGEEVAGYVRNLEEGKVLVTSVRFGPATGPEPADPEPRPSAPARPAAESR